MRNKLKKNAQVALLMLSLAIMNVIQLFFIPYDYYEPLLPFFFVGTGLVSIILIWVGLYALLSILKEWEEKQNE